MDSTTTNFEMIFCPVLNELGDHNGADFHNEEGRIMLNLRVLILCYVQSVGSVLYTCCTFDL